MARPIELATIRTAESSRFLTEDVPEPVAVADAVDTAPDTADKTLSNIHPPWRRSLYALLEQPKSSPQAIALHMLVTFLILSSALVTVLETVPSLHAISARSWFGMETMLVALFTIEYVARCLAWSWSWMSLFKWAISFYGIVDLLAVMPYYIEIMLHKDTSVLFRFSILRMFRLLRVFKPFRYNNTILLYDSSHPYRTDANHRSPGFRTIEVIYFAERGTWDPTLETFLNADGDPSQFSSIPAAAWFVLVTITTVGYGEITPRSFLGRLITVPILMFGLLLVTLPSFVLGREFSHNEHSNSNSIPQGIGYRGRGDGDSPLNPYFPLSTSLLPSHAPPTSRPQQPSSPQPPRSHSRTPPTISIPQYPQYSYPPHTPHRQGTPVTDLSNRKLAQNQTELSAQITELREALERQGEVVLSLLGALREGQTASGVRVPNGNPGTIESRGTGRTGADWEGEL
ncbi:hypothetical protein H0H92_013477 [Tricholoma furcatifolium]|nr:hypothetical protein H0H92_013477 [Tricholoma furcatifolium]